MRNSVDSLSNLIAKHSLPEDGVADDAGAQAKTNAGAQSGGGSATTARRRGRSQVLANGTHINVRLVSDRAASLKAKLASSGISTFSADASNVVSASLTPEQIAALDDADVVFGDVEIAETHAVVSQGDAAQYSNIVRTLTCGASTLSGAGVKVGVLSDSFNCLGGTPRFPSLSRQTRLCSAALRRHDDGHCERRAAADDGDSRGDLIVL